LQWADFSIDFISGQVDENAFRSASFPDGTQLFNEREIAHMLDVRNLTIIMLWVWRILMVIFLLYFFYTKREGISHLFLSMLGFGARVTIGIILAVLLFLVINFNQLFTAFHRIFFEGDTWLFYFSDTLIRLFPLKFWQDLFIFIGVFSLATSIGLMLLSAKRSLIKKD
jgi:integral membrane protein (TIGR01906 family)